MSNTVKEQFEQFVKKTCIQAYQCLPINPCECLPEWLQGYVVSYKKDERSDGNALLLQFGDEVHEIAVGDWVSNISAGPLDAHLSIFKNDFFFENFMPLRMFGFRDNGSYLPLRKIVPTSSDAAVLAYQWDGLVQTRGIPLWMNPLKVCGSDFKKPNYLIMMTDYNGNDAVKLRTIQNGLIKDIHHTDWILLDRNSNFIFMSNEEFTGKYTDITPEIFAHAAEQNVVTMHSEFTRIYAPVAVTNKTVHFGKAKQQSPVVDFYQWDNEDVSNRTFVPSWVINLINDGVIVKASSLDMPNGTALGPYILKASSSETEPLFYLKNGVYLVSKPSGKLKLFSEKDFYENYDIVK